MPNIQLFNGTEAVGLGSDMTSIETSLNEIRSDTDAIIETVNTINTNTAGGGGIKSIQRGTVSVSTESATITISEVDTNKSFIIINGVSGNEYGTYGVYLESFDNTSFSLKTGIPSCTASWQVIEFA